MKAWRMYGINDIRLDVIPIPEVIPGSVLIKVMMLQPSVTEVGVEVTTLNPAGAAGGALERVPPLL